MSSGEDTKRLQDGKDSSFYSNAEFLEKLNDHETRRDTSSIEANAYHYTPKSYRDYYEVSDANGYIEEYSDDEEYEEEDFEEEKEKEQERRPVEHEKEEEQVRRPFELEKVERRPFELEKEKQQQRRPFELEKEKEQRRPFEQEKEKEQERRPFSVAAPAQPIIAAERRDSASDNIQWNEEFQRLCHPIIV